jgi:hypothetical protein
MSITLTSPVTGAAQTGFTSPTYTMSQDTAVDSNAKRYIVTTAGGTQTGVRVHSISDPFAVTFVRQKVLNALPSANPITGKYPRVPRNRYWVLTEKGANYATSQSPDIAHAKTMLDIPAGSDAQDAPNLRALTSLHSGVFWQVASGMGDTLVNGNL